MKRLVVFAFLISACFTPAIGVSNPEPQTVAIPDFDVTLFKLRLETSTRPIVVNVWGSWCIPCRSEAPLLAEAHSQYKDRIEFIGIDIEDTQTAASAFIDEFGIEFENLFDPGATVNSILPGFGTPTTFFIAAGGEVVSSHFGVIDEQQLALQLDELLRR